MKFTNSLFWFPINHCFIRTFIVVQAAKRNHRP